MKITTKTITLILLGGVIAVALPFLRSDWSIATLCDGFSLVSVLFLSYGGFLFLLKHDAFFGTRFLLKRVKNYLFPFSLQEKISEKQTENRRNNEQVGRLVALVGAGYFGGALIFLFFV
jgi:hypothetical protein